VENKKLPAKRGHMLIIKDRIPFLQGRPEREHAISHEDIIDLEIILNTNDTIDAIIEDLE
jgi:hypothetical protein